jgi:alkylresorcinol/alkylpyrone synthase
MRIAGIGSAFPEHYYTQEALVAGLKNIWRQRLPNVDILDRLDESMKVDGRYTARPIEFYQQFNTWGEANDVWIQVGLEIGEKALCYALAGSPHRLWMRG